MKNLLTIIFLMLTVCAIAQTPNSYTSFVADTTTEAETEYLVLSSANAITKNYAVTITVQADTISGTATVTAMPQGSFDNNTFYDIESSTVTVNNAGTCTNKKFVYPNAYWRYYRVKLVSTGTGVTTLNGELGIKKK